MRKKQRERQIEKTRKIKRRGKETRGLIMRKRKKEICVKCERGREKE